jgi:chorismate synthase
MAGNSFGKLFKLTTYRESHGEANGGIIDGCPAGLKLDLEFIQNELSKRKPGQSKIVTQRKEDDKVEILSGTFKGETIGSPVAMMVRN